MDNYLELLRDVYENGEPSDDRTGVGTRFVWCRQWRHDLSDGFPLLTTKRVFWKGVVEELLWFLRGETNVKSLQNKGVHIWDAWGDCDGNLGPIYGSQWRNWGGYEIDQIFTMLTLLEKEPTSRRNIVSAWNPEDLNEMALDPCHYSFQVRAHGGKLNMLVNMRSADIFLGVPFNIASYALLNHMICDYMDLTPGELVFSFADLHIYNNLVEQVEEQLTRSPRELPRLEIVGSPVFIERYKFEDFKLIGYDPHPTIKGDVAV